MQIAKRLFSAPTVRPRYYSEAGIAWYVSQYYLLCEQAYGRGRQQPLPIIGGYGATSTEKRAASQLDIGSIGDACRVFPVRLLLVILSFTLKCPGACERKCSIKWTVQGYITRQEQQQALIEVQKAWLY